MSEKVINGKPVREVVRFSCFFFRPNFHCGDKYGRFTLEAKSYERGTYMCSSDIVDIHNIDGVIYIETRNSVYQLDGTKRIRRLQEVTDFVRNKDSSATEFWEKYVPNELPTERGWRVY